MRAFIDSLFVLLLIAVVIFSIPCHPGIGPDDPATIVKYAHQLQTTAHLPIDNTNASHRVGVYGVYALFVDLVKPVKYLTLVTTGIFLAMLVFLYFILRGYNQNIAFFVCASLGLAKVVLQEACVVMGDVITTFATNAPLLIYFSIRFKTNVNNKSIKFYGLFAGLFFIWAFLAKESIAFYLPLVGVLIFHDWKNTSLRKFWIYTTGTFLGLFGLILVWYFLKTGNPFFRFLIVNNSDSDIIPSVPELLMRLTYQPFQMLVENYETGLLALLALIQILRKDLSAQEEFFRQYLVFTLAMWWFSTMSLSYWKVVPLVPRLWMPMMIPLAINAACGAYYIATASLSSLSKKQISLTIAAFWVVALLLLRLSYNEYLLNAIPQFFFKTFIHYTLISGFLIFCIWFPPFQTNTIKQAQGLIIICACLFFQLSYQVFNFWWWLQTPDKRTEYDVEKDAIERIEKNHPEGRTLVNRTLAANYEIYTDFKPLTLTPYNIILPNELKAGDYLLVDKHLVTNGYTGAESVHQKQIIDSIPAFITNPPLFGFKKTWENRRHVIWVKE